jgi:hypothetical protein
VGEESIKFDKKRKDRSEETLLVYVCVCVCVCVCVWVCVLKAMNEYLYICNFL